MSTIRVSATAARNNFFELLNKVADGVSVIIEKDKKEVAILSPKTAKTDWVALRKALKNAHGILKDLTPEEIAPAHFDEWKNFGNWDNDLTKK